MELDYALLAEKASRLDDGRLVVFGGDIDGVTARKLPVLFETTLVAKMLVEKGEAHDGHEFGIDCTDPRGNRVSIIKSEPLGEPDVVEGMLAAAGLIATLKIVIREAGIYRLHLIVDGKERKTFPFLVDAPERNKSEAKHDENAIAH
jgi:hypothetical protein